mmetsp:Transcript_15899/g.23949  ORF Transcript_15899/g.23949 Transcript_15899/m.23949 type:complete len:387 (+) Transcript_15899:81-1241(+)|eukprot:CAMPEP_0185028552 /NCGR_PEP_ID=MMETSP1103-20130426/14328_1 /TAXON_ID=36769 /ORGANISM="Paraphysomonas bandaiensis, Strain Caron Lab Isolate" /LENGTH=386 /DNA_ID=CAMNT_0027563001 /DNA_START=72 /DNA_END=1232 /DNA_ORIENTATION=-
MSIKSQAARRRNSYIEIASNPLESGEVDENKDRKLEIVTSCSLIERDEFSELMLLFSGSGDNASKLKYLETKKDKYLFSSADMIQLLDLIPSKKTQIAMIEMLGPRLTDPKKRADDILGRFRFSEEKKIVQEVLKMRAHRQNCDMYSTSRVPFHSMKRNNRDRSSRNRRNLDPFASRSPSSGESEVPAVGVVENCISASQNKLSTKKYEVDEGVSSCTQRQDENSVIDTAKQASDTAEDEVNSPCNTYFVEEGQEINSRSVFTTNNMSSVHDSASNDGADCTSQNISGGVIDDSTTPSNGPDTPSQCVEELERSTRSLSDSPFKGSETRDSHSLEQDDRTDDVISGVEAFSFDEKFRPNIQESKPMDTKRKAGGFISTILQNMHLR